MDKIVIPLAKKLKIRPYLESPNNTSFFADRASFANVRKGDIYLKRLFGFRADEWIPVNYFDLIGVEGGYGHRNHYRFFMPNIVTDVSPEGFEYQSIQFSIGSIQDNTHGVIGDRQRLDGLLLHLNDKGEFELFVDKDEFFSRTPKA